MLSPRRGRQWGRGQKLMCSGRTRGLIHGLESLIWATAVGVGPVLGGVFSEFLSWKWCFRVAGEAHLPEISNHMY